MECIPGVFSSLPVKTAEGTYSLIELAQISQKNPQLIVINMVSSPQVRQQFSTTRPDQTAKPYAKELD